jgi:hypothetical protein
MGATCAHCHCSSAGGDSNVCSPDPTCNACAWWRAFEDGEQLLASADRLRLEGIVSKRKASTYRSGLSRDWLKIKTAAWRAANRERWRLFERHWTT